MLDIVPVAEVKQVIGEKRDKDIIIKCHRDKTRQFGERLKVKYL